MANDQPQNLSAMQDPCDLRERVAKLEASGDAHARWFWRLFGILATAATAMTLLVAGFFGINSVYRLPALIQEEVTKQVPKAVKDELPLNAKETINKAVVGAHELIKLESQVKSQLRVIAWGIITERPAEGKGVQFNGGGCTVDRGHEGDYFINLTAMSTDKGYCDSPGLSDSGGGRIMVPEGGPKDEPIEARCVVTTSAV